jgi:hypothetical protein
MRHGSQLLAGAIVVLLAQSAGATDASAPPPAPAVDAGPAATKDQKAYRNKYVSDTLQKESALLKGLVWTPEVRKAVSEHWRRAYRTLRVRELAEDSGDTGTIPRADDYIRKIDGHLFAYLAELAPSLPAIPPAPTLAAPASGAQIPIGSALTITMTPGANVTPTEYYCVASEGGGHALVNWDPAAKHYGAQPTCTFAANDPRWAKFAPGKGGIWTATLTKAKSPKGVEYSQWSAQRYIPVQFTGGAK